MAAAQTCTAPASPVNNPVPSTPFLQYVPHISTDAAFGFGTKLTIVNFSGSTNQIVFNNVSKAGAGIDTMNCTIPPNGTLRIAQPPNSYPGANEPHWAIVGSQQPVGVNIFFERVVGGTVVNTVGFNNEVAKSSFTFPVEFQTPADLGKPLTIGVAVANPNNASNTITVTLLDKDGTTLGSRNTSLPAFGQLAVDFLLSTNSPLNLASLLPAGNFVGKVVVSGSGPIVTVGVGDDLGPFFSAAGMNPPEPAGGGANIAATLTLSPSDPAANVGAGTCGQKKIAVSGARPTMAVAISPGGDPTANGFGQVIWSAFVDANDSVTAQFCKIAKGSAVLLSPQAFNIRVLTTSTASASGSLTLASGTTIPAGSCVPGSASVAGATTSSAVQLTPATDPGNADLPNLLWIGYVPSAGTVAGEFCAFGGGVLISSGPLNFNVAVLN